MHFDDCNTPDEVFELAKKLKSENHPDRFVDEEKKKVQEQIFKSIDEEKNQRLKEFAEAERINFNKHLISSLGWNDIKKEMSPEMKEIGKDIVTKSIHLASEFIANRINKKIWK